MGLSEEFRQIADAANKQQEIIRRQKEKERLDQEKALQDNRYLRVEMEKNEVLRQIRNAAEEGLYEFSCYIGYPEVVDLLREEGLEVDSLEQTVGHLKPFVRHQITVYFGEKRKPSKESKKRKKK